MFLDSTYKCRLGQEMRSDLLGLQVYSQRFGMSSLVRRPPLGPFDVTLMKFQDEVLLVRKIWLITNA